MRTRNTRDDPAPQKKRLRTILILAAAAAALLLLIFLGLRLRGWLAQRSESRVIALVNPWNDVDKNDFSPRLEQVEGFQVDRSCAAELRQMLADCRAAGCTATLTAGYRSREEQLMLFNNEVDRQMASGRSADAAYAIAEQRIGAPGTSEHELGLAVDIEGSAAQSWLRENAWRYGFILRYPEGSESVTGRSADNSHYRYVGRSTAEQIYSLGITLEEYMGMFYTQEAEIIFE